MSDSIRVPLIPECSACILNSMKTLIPILTQDKERQFELSNLVYKRLAEGYAKNLSPLILSVTIHQELYKTTGVENPYKEIKRRSREAALTALPLIVNKIEEFQGHDRFQACLAASIAGNVIDFNVGEHRPDLDSLVEVFEGIRLKGFTIDDSDQLWESLNSRSGRLLFLADNAGEVILDIPLLRLLKELRWEITFVVKGRAMINDATLEDVQGTEIEELTTVKDSGAWAHGVPIEFVSEEFLTLMKDSDLVISKGQANIESVPEIQEKTGVETYYITKAKCSHISRAINATIGDNVVIRRVGAQNFGDV
ncbi:MAG: damage-control phosphatase ARMT1 family protein [Candidatus Thorarchaeota archaeon]